MSYNRLQTPLQSLLQDRLTLYFDGACEPNNPGGIAAYGWRLVDEAGLQVASDYGEICRGPGATSNLAEWYALTAGLRYLLECGWSGALEIRGDSQLIIYQLIGKYGCHSDNLIPYYEECRQLLHEMNWNATWIKRDQNREADELSHLVYGNMKLRYRYSRN